MCAEGLPPEGERDLLSGFRLRTAAAARTARPSKRAMRPDSIRARAPVSGRPPAAAAHRSVSTFCARSTTGVRGKSIANRDP